MRELHLFTTKAAAEYHGFGGVRFTLRDQPDVLGWYTAQGEERLRGMLFGRVVVHRAPYPQNARLSADFQRGVFTARLQLREEPMEYIDDA